MQPPEPSRPLLVCVDGSDYTHSVCDYAAWLGGAMEVPIRLLHVREPGVSALSPSPIEKALERFAENGVEDVVSTVEVGMFTDVAVDLAAGHSLVVLGKRGRSAAGERARMGSNVESVVQGSGKPTFLAPSLFLPMSRAVVLLNADLEHQRATLYVRSQAWLQRLALDVVVMTSEDEGEAKLSWARKTLAGAGADVFAMPCGGPDHALAEYRKRQATDLLVMSREIARSTALSPTEAMTEPSIWAWRAPLLIC